MELGGGSQIRENISGAYEFVGHKRQRWPGEDRDVGSLANLRSLDRSDRGGAGAGVASATITGEGALGGVRLGAKG